MPSRRLPWVQALPPDQVISSLVEYFDIRIWIHVSLSTFFYVLAKCCGAIQFSEEQF